MVVGCGQSDVERLEEETKRLEAELEEKQLEIDSLESEIKASEKQSAEKLAAAIKNAHAWKDVFEKSAETNKLLQVEIEKKKDDLIRLSVVGEYDYKEGSPAYRHFFLENGILERYRSGEKRNDAKWSIVKGEIHVVHDFGEIHVFRINKDKSITEIALIKDKKRSDWPYEVNTLKKIK